jgi:hypothetical protein
MGLAATHRVDGGRSLVVGNEEMRGLRRAVAACWSREKRSQGLKHLGIYFFPMQALFLSIHNNKEAKVSAKIFVNAFFWTVLPSHQIA